MTEIHFGRALINTSKRLGIITGGGLSPQINKFEQVSSDEHQMSVVRGVRSHVWYPGEWG